MVNIDNENDENIVLDIDNDSIVSDPVAPETRQVAGSLHASGLPRALRALRGACEGRAKGQGGEVAQPA